MINRVQHVSAILFIVTLSAILYLNTLNNGFVYDDKYTVVNNVLIKDFSNLPSLFRKSYFALSGEMTYRPVVTLTYFMDYALYGLKPWGYHLTNIILHSVNSIMFYIFLTLIFKPATDVGQRSALANLFIRNKSLVISLLFVLHPLLTEAVNAVSFREDLLAFLFYMATLNLYISLRAVPISASSVLYHIMYPLSCLTYGLALLSKEMAVTLPVVIFCYEWLFAVKGDKGFRSLFNNRYNTGYMIITLAYIYLRVSYFKNPLEEYAASSLTERLLTIPWLLLSYIKLFLFPISLSADYEIGWVKTPFSLLFIIPSIVTVLLITLVYMLQKREKGIVLGMLFFVVTLMPVYNLVPLSRPLAERYMYIPAAGLCISLGLIFHLVLKSGSLRSEIQPRYLLLVLFFTIISIYTLAVVKRNFVWKDDFSLWFYTVRKLPDNSSPHNQLGVVYFEQGRMDDAIQEYKIALELKPYADYHNNLGLAYANQGGLEAAIQEFQTALRLNPRLWYAHYNLGVAYYKKGITEAAKRELEMTLLLNPYDSEARQALETIGR